MRLNKNSICFENEKEINKLISVLLEWQDDNGRDSEIQRMIDLLDIMLQGRDSAE